MTYAIWFLAGLMVGFTLGYMYSLREDSKMHKDWQGCRNHPHSKGNPTVSEMFEAHGVGFDFINENFDNTPYWQKAKKFIGENYPHRFHSLSPKQQEWIESVLEQCLAIKG